MSLIERIDADLKHALKESDKITLSTLRLAKAALKNKEIEKGSHLSDDEVISVLSSLSKQRRESIEQYAKGGRDDLVSSERAELAVLQEYLPQQLSEAELEKIIRAAIQGTSASGAGDIGKVMKVVMPQVKGRADGKLVNKKVSELLAT